MKTFTFWYSETDTYRAWISAESEEEARKLLTEADDIRELPDFESVGKAYDYELHDGSLEEVTK